MQDAAGSRFQPYVRSAGCSQFQQIDHTDNVVQLTPSTQKQRRQLETKKPKRNSQCDCARPRKCDYELALLCSLCCGNCERGNFLHVEPSLSYMMLSLSSNAFTCGASTCPQTTYCSRLSQRPLQGLLCQRSSKHLKSCHSSFRTFLGANASKTRRRITSTPATNATDLPLVNAGSAPCFFPVGRMISCAHWLTNMTQKIA